MATANGNVVGPVLANGWRSVLVYTLTDNGTSVTVNTTLKMQLGSNYAMFGATVKGTTTIGSGSGSSSSKTITGTYDQSSLTTILTKSRTYTKTGSDQSIAISGAVTVGNGTSTASATVTIPKLTYRVTYSANGGNANSVPEAQTKIHNTTLVLSTTVPKRPWCSFLGWNTKADGSGTHYAAGGTYTGNAALTLYAIWLGVSVPTIEVKRTDAEGLEADEGTYGTVAASWQALGSVAGTVAVTAHNATASSAIELSGNTSGSFAAGRSASGNVASAQPFGGSLSTDSRYRIVVTATVTSAYNGGSTVTATATAYIDYAYITMDFRAGGHGVTFGGPAVADGLHSYMPATFHDEVNGTWRAGTTATTDGTVTTLPASGTYLLATAHNTTAALCGLWLVRTAGNRAHNLAGGAKVTITVSGTSVTTKTSSSIANVYYQRIS